MKTKRDPLYRTFRWAVLQIGYLGHSMDPHELSSITSGIQDLTQETGTQRTDRLDISRTLNLALALQSRNHRLLDNEDRCEMEKDEEDDYIGTYLDNESSIFHSYIPRREKKRKVA